MFTLLEEQEHAHGKVFEFMVGVFEDFFYGISEASNILTDDNVMNLDKTAQNLLKKGSESIEAVALTIVAVCFLIDLMQNVLLKADQLRVEDIIKALIKLVMAKAIISCTADILAAFRETANNIIQAFNGGFGEMGEINPESMINKDELDYAWYKADSLTELGYFCTHIIEFAVVIVATLALKAFAYARSFELKILEMASSLPMAFVAWSETKDMAKKFLQNYFAVCIQGVVLVMCSAVMISIISSNVALRGKEAKMEDPNDYYKRINEEILDEEHKKAAEERYKHMLEEDPDCGWSYDQVYDGMHFGVAGVGEAVAGDEDDTIGKRLDAATEKIDKMYEQYKREYERKKRSLGIEVSIYAIVYLLCIFKSSQISKQILGIA